jgi:hypothetical protein
MLRRDSDLSEQLIEVCSLQEPARKDDRANAPDVRDRPLVGCSGLLVRSIASPYARLKGKPRDVD